MILSVEQFLDNNALKNINYMLQYEVVDFYLPNYSKYEYNFDSKEINAFCPSRIGMKLNDGNVVFFRQHIYYQKWRLEYQCFLF